MLSVVIPTLNAQSTLPFCLSPLVAGAMAGLVREVIVSDGGSTDATLAIAEEAGCRLVGGPKGRGLQLRAGADAARGDWLLFLHADSVLDAGWIPETQAFIARQPDHSAAAAFTFAFDEDVPAARRAAFWVGVRCALFRLPYGDQGLLISRRHYDGLGGYRPIALMEDVDIVRRIGRARLALLRTRLVTSAEKYRRTGYTRRALRNLGLVMRFYLGADPARLARLYD
jgi:rSAM/selenodomain-associated transferase 2